MMNANWQEYLVASGARIDNGRVTDFGDPTVELAGAKVMGDPFGKRSKEFRADSRDGPVWLVYYFIGEVQGDEQAAEAAFEMFFEGVKMSPTDTFALFRALDIFKPWPVDRIQNLTGGYGIMADDLLAGVYSLVALRLCIAFVLPHLPGLH